MSSKKSPRRRDKSSVWTSPRRGRRASLLRSAAVLVERSSNRQGWASTVVIPTWVTDHRIGFTILDQVTNIGEVALTMIPSDTSELVALGAADPYLYDIWVVFADGSEFPIISLAVDER